MLFKDLTNSQLNILSARIILDFNLPVRMYKNPYDVNPAICKDFFEGYIRYLMKLAEKIQGVTPHNHFTVALAQDNYDNLIAYRSIYEANQISKAHEFLR